MAADQVTARSESSAGNAAGDRPAGGAEKKDAPVRKAGAPMFSRRGLLIFAGVAAFQGVALIGVLLLRGKGEAEASMDEEHDPHAASSKSHEKDVEAFLKVARSILELGELKVPVSSTQPRAPRSITAHIQVVISQHLEEKLSGGGGGHGGGSKNNPQKTVLILNMRSIVRAMMESEGVRLLEPNAKIDFERRAKDRLNNVQIDGDEEKTMVMRILKGQILQVIIDKFDTHSF